MSSQPHRPALLVVDMQDTMLSVMHCPNRTVTTIRSLTSRARASNVPVVTVRQHGCGPVLPELTPRKAIRC